MFKGIVTADGFSLFHNTACLVVQTSQDYGSLERIRKRLALTLTYAFFVEADGSHLAELKANKLWRCVKAHLPKDLNFEIADTTLGNVIEQTIIRNALEWFGDYCQHMIYSDTSDFVSVLKTDAPASS